MTFNKLADIVTTCQARYELNMCHTCMYNGEDCVHVKEELKCDYPAQQVGLIYKLISKKHNQKKED